MILNFDLPNYPEPEEGPKCPICGDECERIFIDMDGYVAYCDGCIPEDETDNPNLTEMNAWQWQADEREAIESEWADRKYKEMKEMRQC